jgi:hypothetical protein
VPAFPKGFIATTLSLATFLMATPAWGDTREAVAQARALMEAHQSGRAYALLAPLEGANAGNVEFDYWLGAAALDAGYLDQALTALERVLAKEPGFHAARLELGRAYLRMGSLDLAEQEFQVLRARAPDAPMRALMQQYLDEIARLRARQRYAWGGYLEANGGRDTNLSSTTRDFPGAVYSSFGLPGVEPTGNAIRRADNFLGAAAGADVAWKVSEERVAFALADVRWRGYQEFHDYDSTMADAIVGYQDRGGAFTWTVSGFVQGFRENGGAIAAVEGTRIKYDSDAAGVGVEIRRPFAAQWQLAMGLQLAGIRYPTNPGQDVRNFTLSAAAEWRPAWFNDGAVVGKAFYGEDKARQPLNDFTDTTASRHTYGLRAVAVSERQGRFSWQGALSWTRRVDDDPFARALLVEKGRDDLFEGYLQLSWRVAEGWSLSPYASYTYNRSNIPVYAFRKAEGGLALRREFR